MHDGLDVLNEWSFRFGRNSAPSLGILVGPLSRPIEASKAPVCYVCNTSILLKNSVFRVDHNLKGHGRP